MKRPKLCKSFSDAHGNGRVCACLVAARADLKHRSALFLMLSRGERQSLKGDRRGEELSY